jgi:predicted DNA-binding protein
MNPSAVPQPRHKRYHVRWQAQLDAETHATLEALAKTFHRKRAQILRHVMPWALARMQRWTIAPSIPDRPHLVHMLVDPELCQRVQDAAAHGVSVAAWVRQAMRQVTPEDFPPSWRAEASAARSHESGDFHRKCGLRLDAVTSRILAAFMHTFERSAAAIIRELIAQASPEDFPPSWHMAAIEPRPQDARAGGGRARASHEHPRAP